jgi:hypothetical protein
MLASMNLLRPLERDLVVNGLRLRLLDWGGDGRPPLLLLHGFTGHAEDMTAPPSFAMLCTALALAEILAPIALPGMFTLPSTCIRRLLMNPFRSSASFAFFAGSEMRSSTSRPMTSSMFSGLEPSIRMMPVDCADLLSPWNSASRMLPAPNSWL